MIKITNTTRGGIGILPTMIIPAGGSIMISEIEYRAALKSPTALARFNSGALVVAEKVGVITEVNEPMDEPAVELGAAITEREDLIARGKELGLKFGPRTHLKTMRAKVKEAMPF